MKRLLLETLYRLGADHPMRFAKRHEVVVVAYHGFTDLAAHPGTENGQGKHLRVDLFARQLDFLQRHYRIVPLQAVIDAYANGGPLPPCTLAITMDDGYRSNYTLAYPLLRERGLPATVFLTTGFLDGYDLQWSDRIEYALSRTAAGRLDLEIGNDRLSCGLSTTGERLACDRRLRRWLKTVPQETRADIVDDVERQLGVRLQDAREIPDIYQPLSWNDVREMTQGGLVSFGSHTVSHFILTRCDAARAKAELVDSRRRIEQEVDGSCRLFCYPNGQAGCFDAGTKAMLREAGYACGITTVFGTNDMASDVFELRRLYTDRPDMARFALTVSGVMGALETAKRAAWRVNGS